MLGCRVSTARDQHETALPKPHRTAARNAGLAHFADVALGRAAWVRHQPGDSCELWRSAAGGHGISVSRAAPPGAAEVDRGGLESFREQATRAGVPPDGQRQEAARFRTLALGATFGRDCGRAQSGGAGESIVTFSFWR